MEVTISANDTDPDRLLLEELQKWIAIDPTVANMVSSVRRPPRSGELGSVVDLLTVSLGSGGAVTGLVAALKTFFSQAKNRNASVDVHILRPDGTEVVAAVSGVSQSHLDAALERIQEIARGA